MNHTRLDSLVNRSAQMDDFKLKAWHLNIFKSFSADDFKGEFNGWPHDVF